MTQCKLQYLGRRMRTLASLTLPQSHICVGGLSFSAARGFKLHPQRVGPADAAHRGLCGFTGVLHLQVQKVRSDKEVNELLIISRALTSTSDLLVLRKIPWIHVQTEEINEKEPEVISTVAPGDILSKVKLSEFPSQKELMEKELEARSRGTLSHDRELYQVLVNVDQRWPSLQLELGPPGHHHKPQEVWLTHFRLKRSNLSQQYFNYQIIHRAAFIFNSLQNSNISYTQTH